MYFQLSSNCRHLTITCALLLLYLSPIDFNVDRTRIVRHINNIYSDNELDMLSTCAENAQVQFEGEILDSSLLMI